MRTRPFRGHLFPSISTSSDPATPGVEVDHAQLSEINLTQDSFFTTLFTNLSISEFQNKQVGLKRYGTECSHTRRALSRVEPILLHKSDFKSIVKIMGIILQHPGRISIGRIDWYLISI